MADQDKVQLDKDGFPVPKSSNKPSLELDKEGLPIPVKKKETSSPSGDKTLKVSEINAGEQKVSPSPSDGSIKPSLNQPSKYKGFSLKPIETQFMPKPLSLNEQGYIGDGAKKSNLLKAVDDQFQMHIPQTPQTKDALVNLTKDFSENNIDKIKETRDVILGGQESKMAIEQEDARRRNFSGSPVAPALPLDIKKDLDAYTQSVADVAKYNIDLTKDVFNNYLRYSITDKHVNPPDQAAKDKLKGFGAKPEASKELYKSIGSELVKNNVPLPHDFTGNSSYDYTRAGLESVIDNLQMEANDLISEGKSTGNITLLNLAKDKAIQIDNHKKVLSNLADDYPDVQALNTARYIGDVMDEMGIAKLTTSSSDVYAAANEIQKRSPEAYKKIEKYIRPIAESEGSGLFGQLVPGKVPRSNVGAQVEQSIESFLKEKAGQAVGYESSVLPGSLETMGKSMSEELREEAESPLLQGSSKAGAFKSKIVLGEDGTFIEKPNENYGVINWNNAVRSITHALPGLAEWITYEKVGGAIAGKLLEKVGSLDEITKVGSIGGATLTEGSFAGAVAKAPFSQTGGLIAASLATGYDPARRMAEELIDDKSGWGDAKKNAFAVFSSMVTAGVFHMLGASPNKILTESLQKTIAKSSIKMLEDANWKNLTEDGVSKILNQAYPVAARLANAAGQSLKEGAQIAVAGETANKINQLSATIVNPKKAGFSITEDDLKGTIGQALTMSLFPAIGRIVSKDGSVPYMAKDALYDAAIHEGIMVDDIHNKVKSGEYTQDQGSMMVRMIRTYKDSIVEASLQTTKDGLPLSNKQVRDWATADFRSKLSDVFKNEKLSGKDVKVDEGIDAEVNQEKDSIVSQNGFHKIEDSEIFKSINPVADGTSKPEKYLDIDPNKKYEIKVSGEQKVVMGDSLQRILSDPDNYVKAKPEEISTPVELRPEITQGNLTDEDFSRVKELEKKMNPVIEGGKVVKPGEALTEKEQTEYDSIIEKRDTGKAYTEKDFRGIRDDDFAKKFLTEKEYQKWHELDREDDPEAKKIISDKKQELLSQKQQTDEKTNETQRRQERDEIKPEPVTEGAGKKEPAPILKKPTRDDLTPTIVVNGKEYSGENHAEAMNKAIAAGEEIHSPDTKEGEKFREENGMFKDKDGNILTRDQTEEKYGIRHSEELLPRKEELKVEDKKKDILDEVTDEKIGEKEYQDFSIDFNDGARAFGKIEDGTASIAGINSPKGESGPIRGTKTYERVLDKLREKGVKTVKIKLQSEDSSKAIDKLIEKGILQNPRDIIGSSGNERPTTFDINLKDEKQTGEVSQPTEGEQPVVEGADQKIEPAKEGEGAQTQTVVPPKPPPPIPPIKTVENTGNPKEEWTAIRKEKQREIDEVRKAYEEQRPKEWSESMKIGLNKIQGEYPDKSLYEGALKHKDDVLAAGYKGNMTTDESLAVLQYLKREIGLQRARLSEDLISDNEQVRENALVQDMAISRDFIDTALAIKEITTTAGRTLSYAQTELGFDPEYGLQIRRMDIARDKLNHSLTDEELAETARLFEQEKELYQREAEAKMASMQQKFDNEISKLQKRADKEKSVEEEPKTAKERKEKLLKQSGKDLADKIRAGKIKGAFSDPLLVGQAINKVIDFVAAAVEKGATLAQAIKDYIEENKIKDAASFTKAFLNHIDREDNRAETLGKIKEIATLNKVEDLHGDMVSKNLIRDYVNSFIGTVEQKDVLQTAADGLKEVLPGIKKERLVEAYLKEGDFRQKTSKELNKGITSATRELKNISRLEEDIADLKGYKELRQRSFPSEAERTAYEKQLQEEKATILRERREDRDRNQKEYQELESERNRQLKRVEELKEKRDKLRDGIREKTDKKVTVDTPEIEGLKKEVAQADKDLRDAENAARKADRDAIALEKRIEKEKDDKLKKQYRDLETERNRQLQRVSDLNKKIEDLNNGIREKREVNKKIDTPEIEDLKKKAEEADKQLREVENAARKVERDAENKRKKISELNESIERLKEKGELLKKSKTKSEKEIGDDIKAKQDELKRVMVSKGLKLANVDKYTKASYETRAQAHNERLNDLSNKVSNMVLSEDLTNDQKKALTLLKERLDKSVVKLDPNSALSQERVLQQGLEDVKTAKAEFDRIADKNIKEIGPIKASLQRIIDQYNRDVENTKQDIALERLKKRLQNEKDEYNRRINAGEFEDNPITELTKADAELIKIQKDRNIIMGEYDKLARKAAREKEPLAKKMANTARSLIVTTMIWKGVTLAKVATSAAVRPQLEGLTKILFGKAYEKYISPEIAHLAKAGGESQSLDSIKKGYQAFLSKYTEEGIQRKIEDSDKKFENADEAYRNALDNLGYIDDKRTKEYKDLLKLSKELKSQRDQALVENASWQIFGFLSPNAFKEGWQVLLHRSSDIEREFGYFDSEQWQNWKKDDNLKQRALVGLDNLEYVTNFVGRSHGALKNFSARQSFAASFLARLEYAVGEGIDVTAPDKILEIANESYLDFERGKYQQYNLITDKFNKIMGFVDREVSPSVAALARTEVAITRVPVNQLWEAIAEYGVGAFTASWETAKQYYKAKGIALKEGYSKDDLAEFKSQIKKNISENLTPKEAATIVRSFRKGGLGMGLYALGVIGGVGFGGFPHRGQTADDKRIQKRELQTGVKELKTGEIEVGGFKMPEVFAKIAEHTPALYPMLFGLGLAQVYKNNVKLGKSTPEAIKNDALAHINVILDGIPQYKLVSPIVGGVIQYGKSFAEVQGVDKDGNVEKLKPFRSEDILHMIPYFGDKTKMLSPKNYKIATAVQKNFETQESMIENDANLSREEKERQINDLTARKEELINQIYESQKH